MRRLTLIVVVTVVAGACSGGAVIETIPRTTTSTVAPEPNTTAVATTEVVTPPSTLEANPLTNRVIGDDELVLMTLKPRDLPLAGFALDTQKAVPNDAAIREALLDPIDEAEDIETYGRLSGARASFRSSRLTVDRRGVLEIHTAINLFETDDGASGYLADFLQDSAKGIGAPRPTDLQIGNASPFVVEELGSEAIGLTVGETVFGESEPTQYETTVVFRVGSLLAFTSLVHAEQDDFRLRALEIGAIVEEQVLAVLRGNIRPPEPEPVPDPLVAFAFRFEQVIDRRTVVAEVEAEGVVVLPDATFCDFTLTIDGRPDSKEYIVIGDLAWFNAQFDANPSFSPLSKDTHILRADMLYCPGWAVPLRDSGLDVALRRSVPFEVELEDGADGLAYTMGLRELEEMGFLPEGSGLTVERFDVVTPVLEEWVLELDLELSGRAPAFVDAFGDEFDGPSDELVRLRFHFEVSRINDAELAVEPPE